MNEGMHMLTTVHIFQLNLYSNHFNLPSLDNLIYNCSSSLKGLAPATNKYLN